jgi:hypothetical protein
MSYKPTQDKQNERTSRTIHQFQGVHFGVGVTDQPDEYWGGSDLSMANSKATLRDGCRKNSDIGYEKTIDDLFFMTLGGRLLLGIVTDGILSAHTLDDVQAGLRRYYTWAEVADLGSWTSLLNGYQWNELMRDI